MTEVNASLTEFDYRCKFQDILFEQIKSNVDITILLNGYNVNNKQDLFVCIENSVDAEEFGVIKRMMKTKIMCGNLTKRCENCKHLMIKKCVNCEMNTFNQDTDSNDDDGSDINEA
eukprot:UN03118